MVMKFVTLAASVTILSAHLAGAQSLAQLGGPANLPPASFKGQQFVDNRGCAYLKAGFGGAVNWVPRIDRNRKPMCGFPPSFGAQVAAVDEELAPVQVAPAAPQARVAVAAPAPQPVLAAPAPQPRAPRPSLLAALFGTPQPIRLVPPAPPVQVAPVQLVQPATIVPPPIVAVPQVTGVDAGCYNQAPRLETVALRTGGTALVCTRGDGTVTGWISPRVAQLGGALSPQMMAGARVAAAPQAPTQQAATAAIPTPPKGYKLAWKDDRLNPMRGQGTARGQAEQDQVWTRDIPAVQVATQQPAVRQQARPQVTVSTMSNPAPQARAAGNLVQVGTFGQSANAAGVKARLAALGLPVSTQKITRKGKVLQIVFAGPFGSAAEAQTALATARAAGFGDAILR